MRNIIWNPLYVESKKKWYKWTYLENELMVARGKGQLGSLGLTCTYCYIQNGQGPTVQHMELLMLCTSLDGRGAWRRMNTCIYMAESLHCSPESTTTLLIGYACVCSHFSHVWLFVTPLTVAHLCPWDSPGKNTGVSCRAFLLGSSRPRDQTCISVSTCTGRWVLYH